jgi:hypothetical protein
MRLYVTRWIPALLTAVACSSNSTNVGPDTPAARAAFDTTAATDWDAGLAVAVAAPVPAMVAALMPQDVAGNNVAASVAAGVSQNFSPSGCANVTVNANVVTFNLNACRGPLGLTNVTGTFTATLTGAMPGLHIQLAADNVSVAGAHISVQTQGTLTLGSDQRTQTFQATSTSGGTGPFGNSVNRSGSYTLAFQPGSACATINSSFTLSGSTGTSSKLVNYTRCNRQCPQSGTVTHVLSNGMTVTLTFNGSSNPTWQASDGNSGTLSITCS